MFGFLFKILLIALIVGGIGGYIMLRHGGISSLSNLPQSLLQASTKLPIDTQVLGTVKENISTGNWSDKLSGVLDSLVTHPDRNSPVVLGIKATNESVEIITDTLLNMPNDKLEQVKQVLCAPVASPSAQ